MGDRNRFWFPARCAAAWILACAAMAAAPSRGDWGEWFVDDPGMPAEACEPYVLVEALAIQRAPGGGGPLVIDADTQLPVLSADTLQFAMAPGLRAVYGRHGPCALGWEVGYVGVYGMIADQLASGTGTLEVPPELSGDVIGLRNASVAFAKYTSRFDSAEANILLTQQNWKGPRISAYEHEDSTRIITWDWLAGFRWAGLSEAAALTLSQDGVPDTYSVRTNNNLFAGQIGFRGRADWGLWALDGWLKAGLAGAVLSQSQDPIIDSVTGDTYRDARFADTADVGGIFDIDVAVSRRIAEHWAIRVGWNSIWLTGVALATNQFDFSIGDTAGTGVANGGTLWLNGITLGLDGRW